MAIGVVVVAGMAVMLGGGEKAVKEPSSAAASQVLMAERGVRSADVDAAGRIDLDPRSGDDVSAAALPGDRPAAADDGAEARRQANPDPPPQPLPPVELTAEQEAANEEYLKVQAAVMASVNSQVSAQQSALRKACWKDTGGASGADFTINASFGAGGELLAMGISDVRGPDAGVTGSVGTCLRQQALALSVPSQGQSVSVDVPLHLP